MLLRLFSIEMYLVIYYCKLLSYSIEMYLATIDVIISSSDQQLLAPQRLVVINN